MESKWFSGVAAADIISWGMLEAIGPISWQKIRRTFKSGKQFLAAGSADLTKGGLTSTQIDDLLNRPKNVAAVQRLLESKKIQLITLDSPGYPPLLKEISDPPLWLYCRGDIIAARQKSLTVVGTRKPTPYALAALEAVISQKLRTAVVLTSGLAYGIDKAVHECSLKAGAVTVAVLAGGLDSIYPIDHHRLAERIVEGGGVLISEYPPLSRPRPWRFPVRNRILAGLSPATVVIEANLKSGSLTTAKSVIDYNRDLFAVPGDITRRQAEGTNFLIKNGAVLLDDPGQLDLYFGLRKRTGQTDGIDKGLKVLVDLLAGTPLTVDQLVGATNSPIETILSELTQLELLEVVCQTETGAYQLKNHK